MQRREDNKSKGLVWDDRVNLWKIFPGHYQLPLTHLEIYITTQNNLHWLVFHRLLTQKYFIINPVKTKSIICK